MEWHAVKYLIDVNPEAFDRIKVNASDKLRFSGVCLGKAPSSKL